MRILYADGSERISRFNGDRAYRANVTYPNGTEDTLYMLRACGNDLRFSGISRYIPGAGFRFEPDPVPQPAAAPTPQPETVRRAEPQPAAVNPGNPGRSEAEDGVITVEIRSGDPKAKDEKEQKDMLRISGVGVTDVTLTRKSGELTLRFTREQEEPDGQIYA